MKYLLMLEISILQMKKQKINTRGRIELDNKLESEIVDFLKGRLQEKRFKHSLGVMNMAERLARKYNVDVEEAKIAGLLHDCAKNMSNQELIEYCQNNGIEIDDIKMQSPGILHADVGADIAKKKFNVSDELKESILYHTLANETMTDLDKIIYISDLIEEGRDLEGLDKIREMAFIDLDKALVMALEYCMENVKQVGKNIHKQSIDALNAAKKRCN